MRTSAYACRFHQRRMPTPTKPVPSKTSDAGSGTAALSNWMVGPKYAQFPLTAIGNVSVGSKVASRTRVKVTRESVAKLVPANLKKSWLFAG
jgi:hypothetical protein